MTSTDLMFASGLCLVECNSNDTIRSAVCFLIPVGFWSSVRGAAARVSAGAMVPAEGSSLAR